MSNDNRSYLDRLRKIQARLNKLDPETLEQATARLKRDVEWVKQAETFGNQAEITCDECQNALPSYVDDAAQGANPQLDYPLVWRHLQTCAACKAVYQGLWQAEPPPKKAPLAQPWRIKTQTTPARKSLHIQFNHQFLHSLLKPNTNTTFRSAPTLPIDPDEMLTRVLLQEDLEWDGQLLSVEIVYRQPPYTAEKASVLAKLIGLDTLPAGLQAELLWGDATFSATVNAEGVAEFNDLAHQELQTALNNPASRFELNLYVDTA